MGKTILKHVIESWQRYPLSTMIFVADGVEMSPETEVTLVPFIDRSSRGPDGTSYYLGIEQIRDVLEALEQEGVCPTALQKFIAIEHYAEHDAFISPSELKSERWT